MTSLYYASLIKQEEDIKEEGRCEEDNMSKIKYIHVLKEKKKKVQGSVCFFFFKGLQLIAIRIKRCERGWHRTQGAEVTLLYGYFCRVFYSLLQLIAAETIKLRCNSICTTLK